MSLARSLSLLLFCICIGCGGARGARVEQAPAPPTAPAFQSFVVPATPVCEGGGVFGTPGVMCLALGYRTLDTCQASDRQRVSEEMAALVKADQDARTDFHPPATWEEASAFEAADRQRRVRVSELFAAGCLSTAPDYAAAALIFQHGDIPEHYVEAYLFASRAVALGDASQKRLMADAIDRFLLHVGHRQLFGTNELEGKCDCLWPVEPGFPDELRREYGLHEGLEQRRADVRKKNENKPECTRVECDYAAAQTPRGSFPGLW